MTWRHSLQFSCRALVRKIWRLNYPNFALLGKKSSVSLMPICKNLENRNGMRSDMLPYWLPSSSEFEFDKAIFSRCCCFFLWQSQNTILLREMPISQARFETNRQKVYVTGIWTICFNQVIIVPNSFSTNFDGFWVNVGYFKTNRSISL